MAKATAKTHKSRKTGPAQAPGRGPSSTALTTKPRAVVSSIPSVLQQKPVAGESTPAPPAAVPTPVEGVAVLPYVEPDPKKQWWYRPADSKARKVVEKIVVMDAAGQKDAEIAKRLKTTEATIRQYRYLAKKNGWLRLDEDGEEEMVDLEAELAMTVDRKIVRNIDASLDGQMTNWQTHEMTMAAAKGRGIFKGDKTSEGMGNALAVVKIEVIMPPVGASDQTVVEANIGGAPAYVEGEVVEAGPAARSGEVIGAGAGAGAAASSD
jgi:transposase